MAKKLTKKDLFDLILNNQSEFNNDFSGHDEISSMLYNQWNSNEKNMPVNKAYFEEILVKSGKTLNLKNLQLI
ncbi:MAG: hypothetical protein HC906_08375 [Bacteroidales bacterium]|nr:hypothetical protein [Bacteroidales bacterium]